MSEGDKNSITELALKGIQDHVIHEQFPNYGYSTISKFTAKVWKNKMLNLKSQ